MSRHHKRSKLREWWDDYWAWFIVIPVALIALTIGGAVIYLRYIQGGTQQLGDKCTLDRECSSGKCIHHNGGRWVCEPGDYGTHDRVH